MSIEDGEPEGSKPAIRRALQDRRRRRAAARPPEEGDALAAALADHLLAWLGQHRPLPGIVLAYDPLRSEPPVQECSRRLCALGVRVLLPVTPPRAADGPAPRLGWREADGGPDLGPDAALGAGLVLAPGLAVDAHGTRLGKGGGYYDRVLTALPHDVPVLCVLDDDEVLAQVLPREPHDAPVTGTLTPGGGVRLITAEDLDP